MRAQAAGAQREAAAAQAAAAAAADAAAAAAVEAAEEPAEDEDEYLALPEAQHYMTVPAFRQEEVVRPLRDHFDER